MNFEEIFYSRSTSEKAAVIEKSKIWTYRDFIRFASYVKQKIVINKYSKVCICLNQGFYSYVLIWGCYLAGATFCPINTDIPFDRKKYFIDKYNPDIIICEDNDKKLFSQIDCVRRISTFFNDIDNFPSKEVTPKRFNEIAYVIFTSGSTGFPKGVMIKRIGLENFLSWSSVEYGVDESDRWGQFSNLGFDLSIADIFTAILCGAALVPITSPGEKMLPGKMIEKFSLSFWHSVPSVIDLMDKSEHLNSNVLHTLKKMTFCGEKLYPLQLKKLFDAVPSLIIYNTYGPTEITIFCTAIKLTKENYLDYSHNTVCIGDALPGWNVWLENIDDGIGEIVISGENIAKGYLDEEKIINSPFVTNINDSITERKYYTGDYAQLRNNHLYFIGRKDTQIKIMGYRVDLSEIDFFLREYGCTSSITTYSDNKIISFVINKNNDENLLRNYLQSKLPLYYLPHIILFKNDFPMNESGKIDAKTLIKSVNIGRFK